MSRSIHRTRRDLEDAKRHDYADREQHDAELSAIDSALEKKRAVKWHVRREREAADPAPSPTTADSIPIRVLDESRWVRYPASADDVRSVLRLVPPGALDGVRGISLRLGVEEQEEDPYWEPDPFTGRRGVELLPGVYRGQCAGVCVTSAHRSEIQVFAYVYDEAIPNRAMWELYLRLQMLATLMHEIGHHHDFVARTTRGRWLRDDAAKNEIHAERYEHDWLHEYVVPYLERAYPEQCQALQAWIDRHGGLSVPLSDLAGDRRETGKRGMILVDSLFGFPDALQELAVDVALGKPLVETRLGFATMLRCGDHFDATLTIVERILSEDPDHLGALVCQAITFERQGRLAEAQQVAERVVAADPSIVDAWDVLVHVYEAERDWQRSLVAAARVLESGKLSRGVRWWTLVRRARALIELGDLTGAEADLDAIPEGRLRQQVASLRAEIAERRANASNTVPGIG